MPVQFRSYAVEAYQAFLSISWGRTFAFVGGKFRHLSVGKGRKSLDQLCLDSPLRISSRFLGRLDMPARERISIKLS